MEKPGKVIAAFIGVFIAGAVFGAFFSMGIGAQWMSRLPRQPCGPGPQSNEHGRKVNRPNAPLLQIPPAWRTVQLMRVYARRLDLSAEQKQRILPVIERAAQDYRRVQQNAFHETVIIIQRLHQDIVKELTPEQRRKLMVWEEFQRNAIRQMEERQKELRKQRQGAPRAGAPGRNGNSAQGESNGSAPSAAPNKPSGNSSPSNSRSGDSTPPMKGTPD